MIKAKEITDKIAQNMAWLERLLSDTERRYDNATIEGVALASEVSRYLQDPQGVGTEALSAACSRFLSAHSGNFWTRSGQVNKEI